MAQTIGVGNSVNGAYINRILSYGIILGKDEQYCITIYYGMKLRPYISSVSLTLLYY